MSRIGRKAVSVPDDVEVDIDGQHLRARGKLGEAELIVHELIEAQCEGGSLCLSPRRLDRTARAMWGTMRALASNLITGVSQGFTRGLELQGVGYRARIEDNALILQLGFSRDRVYPLPEGVSITCPRPTSIVISGIDRQQVSLVASQIRSLRPPEPYKGKGIRYHNEILIRKDGKKK